MMLFNRDPVRFELTYDSHDTHRCACQSWLGRVLLATGFMVSIWVTGCDSASTRVSVYAAEDKPVASNIVPAMMTTAVSAAVIAPSEPFVIHCLLSQEGQTLLPTEPVGVRFEPSVAVPAFEGEQLHLSLTNIGEYRAFCSYRSGELVDQIGVAFEIRSSLPNSWQVTAPQQECYGANDRFTPTIEIKNHQGEVISEYQAALTVTPASQWEGDIATGIRFLEEGDFTVTVSVISPQDVNSTILPQHFSVHVDRTPPTFDIVTPIANEFITVGDDTNILIPFSGTVTDHAGTLKRLTLNGMDAILPIDTTSYIFDQPYDSRWGLSVLDGVAEDNCGNIAYLAIPIIRSGAYFAPATAPTSSAQVVNALDIRFAQSFVDDHDRNDIDDLATVVQTALNAIDLAATIPAGTLLANSPLISQCNDCFSGFYGTAIGAKLWRHQNPAKQFIFKTPTLNALSLVSGGIELNLSLGQFELPLEASVWFNECSLGCVEVVHNPIHVSATLGYGSIDLSAVIKLNITGGVATSSMDNVQVAINNPILQLNCSSLTQSACDLFSNLVKDTIATLAENTLKSVISQNIAPLLANILNDFAVSTSITLPPPVGLTLETTAWLSTIQFCGPSAAGLNNTSCVTPVGSAALQSTVQLYPRQRHSAISFVSPGSIRHLNVTVPSFAPATDQFSIALQGNMVNQMLWALWYGGAFEFDNLITAFSDTAPEGITIGTHLGLPPVIMPGATASEVILGMGGLEITGSIDGNLFSTLASDGQNSGPLLLTEPQSQTALVSNPIPIRATVSLLVGLDIAFVSATNTIQLSSATEAPKFYMQIDQIGDYAYSAALGETLGPWLSTLLPTLITELVAQIPIPEIDLGEISPSLAGSVWRLHNANADYQNGYLRFNGAMQLTQ